MGSTPPLRGFSLPVPGRAAAARPTVTGRSGLLDSSDPSLPVRHGPSPSHCRWLAGGRTARVGTMHLSRCCSTHLGQKKTCNFEKSPVGLHFFETKRREKTDGSRNLEIFNIIMGFRSLNSRGLIKLRRSPPFKKYIYINIYTQLMMWDPRTKDCFSLEKGGKT